jgi:hypothetical protein
MSLNDCIIFVITLMQFVNEAACFHTAPTELRSGTSLSKARTTEVIKEPRHMLNSS